MGGGKQRMREVMIDASGVLLPPDFSGSKEIGNPWFDKLSGK
jgi:hypothetical protein